MISTTRRTFLRHVGTGVGAGALSLAFANSFAAAGPSIEQMRVLCGFPAGSIPDFVARQVANQLAPNYPRGCVVENRVGAAGQVAISGLKASPADGATLLLAPGAVATVYPAIYAKLNYDPAKDLAPVSVGGEVTLAVAVGPAVPASVDSLPALIDWLRANPKLANIGSPGIGTPPHLFETRLFSAAKLPWVHVGYAGGPAAINDLLGGNIAAVELPEGILREHHDAGKVRIVATSGKQRSTYLPNVPAISEAGYGDVAMTDWYCFFLPGDATSGLIDTTSRAIGGAMANAGLMAAYAATGMRINTSSPTEVASRIATERTEWASVIRENNIHVD